jgi:hypothetical protein
LALENSAERESLGKCVPQESDGQVDQCGKVYVKLKISGTR